MDAELRERERDFAADPSPVTLRALVAELTRSGRVADLVNLILAKPTRLFALDPLQVAELSGDLEVAVRAWRVVEIGGTVFVEVRRSTGTTWAVVLAGDVLELRRASIIGGDDGIQSGVWLRRPPRSWELAEILSYAPQDGEVAETEHAVRCIDDAAGATVEVVDHGDVAQD